MRSEGQQLCDFADAVREVLGLGPLHQDRVAVKRWVTQEERFAATYPWPSERVDASGRVRVVQ